MTDNEIALGQKMYDFYNFQPGDEIKLVSGDSIYTMKIAGDFPFENIYMMASTKSAGSKITFKGTEYTVEELNEHSFDKPIDIALFSVGGSISEKYAPITATHGVTVVDNSSQWRMDPDVPLVVPEVNPDDIDKNNGIIANPNCSMIQVVVPLKPLHEKYKIKRIVYSTYQAVSGSGLKGIEDLKEGLKGNDLCEVRLDVSSFLRISKSCILCRMSFNL